MCYCPPVVFLWYQAHTHGAQANTNKNKIKLFDSIWNLIEGFCDNLSLPHSPFNPPKRNSIDKKPLKRSLKNWELFKSWSTALHSWWLLARWGRAPDHWEFDYSLLNIWVMQTGLGIFFFHSSFLWRRWTWEDWEMHDQGALGEAPK